MSKKVSYKTRKFRLLKWNDRGEIVAEGIEIHKIKTVWFDRVKPYSPGDDEFLCEAVPPID
jgi:hypothetical protein